MWLEDLAVWSCQVGWANADAIVFVATCARIFWAGSKFHLFCALQAVLDGLQHQNTAFAALNTAIPVTDTRRCGIVDCITTKGPEPALQLLLPSITASVTPGKALGYKSLHHKYAYL